MGRASNRKWEMRATRYRGWRSALHADMRNLYRRLFGHKTQFWRKLLGR